MEIKYESIAEAWPAILQEVLVTGVQKNVQHNDAHIVEMVEPLVVKIEKPNKNMIPKGSNWTRKTLEMYADQVFNPSAMGFSYSYGERLNRMDQINEVIRKLNEDAATKQAIAVTWIPEVDNTNTNPPCLQLVDFKIYNGKLQLVAYFRSNDMFAAWPQNAFLLARLAQHVSRKTVGHSNLGPMVIISNGAHIYNTQIEDANKIITQEIEHDMHNYNFAEAPA